MIPKKLRIGSRDSKLAIMQTELVIQQIKARYPQMEIELITLKTTGDLILDKTLDKIGGKGLFVKELDIALLNGRIDLAIHSLKDVPMELNPDLPLVGFSKRGEARDVLVLPENNCNHPVSQNIGSSSARRQLQLPGIFEQPHCSSIRGNIITRLQKLDSGAYSSLILAGAGLIRVGLEHRISRYFSTNEMLPAAGQGTLALQARSDFDPALLVNINDPDTSYSALAERAFVHSLDGGCSSPIAAYANVFGNELQLTGLYYNELAGAHIIRSITGTTAEAQKLGDTLAMTCQKELD